MDNSRPDYATLEQTHLSRFLDWCRTKGVDIRDYGQEELDALMKEFNSEEQS